MKITLADKSVAWFALLSGLTISAVAIWYSVAGLVSIFAAAVVPIIVMGVVLEISKLIATVWLKLNWTRAPVFIRSYLIVAIAILMVITSMGIFGFLSKAHSDAGLVSGDVQSKIAIYDEKIKTAKENIEANRKQLKQMDEAVDQVMGRSTDEKGADKANNIRRSQQRDRSALAKDIEANQKIIAKLNDEAAPIRAEVRKVEAEVGPIKYIAAFVYGDNPDANVLEKAVTWVIIIIVSVFDPLAVILLLASQYSFQWFRQAREKEEHDYIEEHFLEVADTLNETFADELNESPVKEPMKFADPGEHPNDQFETELEEFVPVIEKTLAEQHPYLNQPFSHFKDLQPMVYKAEGNSPRETTEVVDTKPLTVTEHPNPLDQWNKMLEAAEEEVAKEKTAEEILDEGLNDPAFRIIPELQSELKKSSWPDNPFKGDRADVDGRHYIFNGSDWINYDQSDRDAVRALENAAEAELKKKSSYMIKDQDQQITKFKE
jgi:hypothetical protein